MIRKNVSPFLPESLKTIYHHKRQNKSLLSQLESWDFKPDLSSKEVIEKIRLAWGNTGWSADIDYLHFICGEVAKQKLNVLECGSGLSTILMGFSARKSDSKIQTLEHFSMWYKRMDKLRNRIGIDAVQILLAPLKSYGDFEWYSLEEHLLFDTYDFVVCDGPPSRTKGGRIGLLPKMIDRLPKGSRIIMDDSERQDEIEIIEQWSESYPLSSNFVGTDSIYAVLTKI